MNLIDLITEAAKDGINMTVWRTRTGGYQANVRKQAEEGGTVVTDRDPVVALREALKQRVLRGAPAPPAGGYEDLFG